MFSVRIEGQPVDPEVDIRFECGLEVEHGLNGSGWSALKEEERRTGQQFFFCSLDHSTVIVCLTRCGTHMMRELGAVVNGSFCQVSQKIKEISSATKMSRRPT